MNVTDAILLTAAVCFAVALLVSHFGPTVWRWLTTRTPRLVPQLQAIEADASSVISTAEKDLKTMAESPAVSDAAAKIGAALSALRTRAAEAEKALADAQANIEAAAAKQGELDQANAHVADLTSQVADLQAQLATEQANHADDVSAVSALADQAAA